MAKVRSLSRSDFLKQVSERAGAHRRDVEHVWENALSVIQDAVRRGEKVALGGFGRFWQRQRKARDAINPRTGEKIRVAAATLPRFTPGKMFKQYVSGAMRSLPKIETKPMALSPDGGKKAAPKKAAAKKAAPKKKAAAKKPARKPAKRRR
jgi:DNA-binding protein HU-beta